MGHPDWLALRRAPHLRRAVRTAARHAAVFHDGVADSRAAYLRHDVGTEDHRPPDVRAAHEVAVHRLSRRSARLPDAPRLSHRRVSDHRRDAQPRPVDVLGAQPREVPVEDDADAGPRPGAGQFHAKAGVMTMAGVVLGVAIGLVLLLWVVDLIRHDRLYVGYGVIFVLGTLAAMAVLIVPPLLDAVARASSALLPVPALSLVPLVLFTFLMVYVFAQISILSNRVTRLTQELALRSARAGELEPPAAPQP